MKIEIEFFTKDECTGIIHLHSQKSENLEWFTFHEVSSISDTMFDAGFTNGFKLSIWISEIFMLKIDGKTKIDRGENVGFIPPEFREFVLNSTNKTKEATK